MKKDSSALYLVPGLEIEKQIVSFFFIIYF